MARQVKRVVDLGWPGMMNIVEFGNQRFGAQGVVHGVGNVSTTKQFYDRLGFTQYLAIDVNTDMGAVVGYLNEPLSSWKFPEEVSGRFDLVTNNGTGEHIFDQAAVFRNAHDLCRVGGVMLHVLPFSPWINHGFYTFQPILFRDLAAANGYEIMFIVIDHRDDGGREVPKADWPRLFVEKQPQHLIKLMSLLRQGAPTVDLLIGVAMHKKGSEPFRKPLQGKYQGDVETDDLRSKYQAGGV